MKNLKHAKGNLLTMAANGQFDIIVHGCNCQNTMGSGIAKEIKQRFPLAFDADMQATLKWRLPVAKLGNFSYAAIRTKESSFIIVNAYTQLHYLPRGIDHFDYESFQLILRKLEYLDTEGNTRFGFPYIGMGLAGGDSIKITQMLSDFATRHDTTLVEFEG